MIGKVLYFIFCGFWYLVLTISTSTIIPIVLDCNGIGNRLPGNQPLCKDIGLLLSFNKPCATFEENIRNSCSAVFTRYHNLAKNLLAPILELISMMWSEIVKTDIGKRMELALYKIQSFVVKQWNGFQVWWEEDGEQILGAAIDGLVMGMRMTLNVVLDFAVVIESYFFHFAACVKTFFLAWSIDGFNAAMNTLNH